MFPRGPSSKGSDALEEDGGQTRSDDAVYLYDRVAQTTSPLTGADQIAFLYPAISPDGRAVTYSAETVAGSYRPWRDTWLLDRDSGSRQLVTKTIVPYPSFGFYESDVANGGTVVSWASRSNELVHGDTNDAVDAFVRSVVQN